jgi:hypothetical protein
MVCWGSDHLALIGGLLWNVKLKQRPFYRRRSLEDLTVDQIVAFADLFEQNTSKADTYMALIHDDVQKLWVQKQLVELGFPMVAGGSEA